MKAFKGFNKDLTCRGFLYELGKEYEEKGANLCNKGFHACAYPLDCFNYYSPAESRFCEVEIDDNGQRSSDDTKVCGERIKIGAEIGIPGLVKAAIEYTKARTTTEYTDPKAATAGYKGAATAGSYGAATAGDKGAATAGDKGAATAGYKGAATAGDKGAATAGSYGAATAGSYGAATAGDNGAATSRGASATGANGLSVARGNNVKVKGGIGALLVIAEENNCDFDIARWGSAVVDGDKIKADVFYCLDENGNFKECEDENNA